VQGLAQREGKTLILLDVARLAMSVVH